MDKDNIEPSIGSKLQKLPEPGAARTVSAANTRGLPSVLLLTGMTLPECEHNRIFARQYKTVLPTVDSLKRIIRQQRRAFEQRTLLVNGNDMNSEVSSPD